jgi:hypothetical protein
MYRRFEPEIENRGAAGWVAGALALAGIVAANGCGSRCKEVESARSALRSRQGAPNRGADVRVTIPLERANKLIEEVLRDPLTVPLDAPDLGPIELVTERLSATVREVRLQSGPPGKLRFATRVEVRDGSAEVATFALVGEIAPQLVRTGPVAPKPRRDGANAGEPPSAELVIGLGPENLLALKPELAPNARDTIDGAIDRWVPQRLRDRVPAIVKSAAARKLGAFVVGAGYEVVRRTLLTRLGEVTRVRLRLPDVPVAHVDIQSTDLTLVVDILTDLPVRRGLATLPVNDNDIGVRISGSAVAELANWAVETGRAPRWYNRTIEPKPDGEFRPRFDYIAEDRAHPLKVYSFQERNGCSYFRVGVLAQIKLDGDALVATALDRELEAQSANPAIEAAAWVKYFVVGALDRSKRFAAHTRLSVGGRTLVTRVMGASITDDEARFALMLSGP